MTAVADPLSSPVVTGRVASWLASPRRRAGLYAAVAAVHLALTVASAAVVALGRPGADPAPDAVPPAMTVAVSDGSAYYAYLPSVLIDGDLDFANQPVARDRHRRPTAAAPAGGPVPNKWPVGVALTVLPAWLAAHGLALALHAATGSPWVAPNGYSYLYQIACTAWIAGLAALGFALLDRVVTARYRLPGWAAAAGVLGVWIGSNYQYYDVLRPFYAHVPGAFWASALVYLLHRFEAGGVEAGGVEAGGVEAGGVAGRRGSGWLLVGAAGCVGMAVACRATSVVFVPLLLIGVASGWPRFAGRASGRGSGRSAWRAIGWVALGGVVMAMPVATQALSVALQQGAPVAATPQAIGYGRVERFYWTDPALLRSLFSSRAGLFFWSPMLGLAVWGAIRHRLFARVDLGDGRRRVDGLAVGLAVAFLGLWYVNASWYAWWFGDSFGGRAYVELLPLFVIGLSSAFASAGRAGGWRAGAVVAVAALGLLVHAALMAGNFARLVPQGEYLVPWERETAKGWLERI